MEIYAEYGYANIGQRIEWAFRDGLVCRKCQQKMAYLDAVCVCYHADAEFGTHCFGEQCCPLQEFRQPTFCDNLCEWLSKWSQGNSSAGNGSQHVGLNAITNS
jgi:hypothetical protein